MNIVILGSGLIGVSTAYFLQKSGHQVTVIERQNDVALETSFANGGQISACYSEPWSNVGNLKKIMTWLGKEDSPILFKPHLSFQQWRWGAEFLYECIPSRNHENIKKMLKIALYSRKTLQELRVEENLQYEQQANGIITYYTNEHSFEGGKEAAQFISRFGCERTIKTKEELLELEPALQYSTFNIVGGDYTADDESGNAFLYTNQMKKKCEELGVNFIFQYNVDKLNIVNNKIKSALISNIHTNEQMTINADLFIAAMGSYTSKFLSDYNIYLPIYPAKGYSATIDIVDSEKVNFVSLTDSDKKIVFTRLGDKLRIAGTAEFNEYDLSLNPVRCAALTKRAQELFPNGLDVESVKYWTGLRPATPSNVPIIKKHGFDNLYINSGHGTLGWTMAAGSGKLLTQLINGVAPYGDKIK
jgi:D-amino-acid dehydrogenase